MCFVFNKNNIYIVCILQEAQTLLSSLSQFTSVWFLFKSSSKELST